MTTRFFIILFLWTIPFITQAQKEQKMLNKLVDEAVKATKKNQLEKADSLYEVYVNLFRQQQLEKDFQFSESLIYLARRAAQKGRADQAIELQKEVTEIRKTAPDCTFLQWASAMSDLGSFYSMKGDYDKAIKTGLESLSMLKKKVGTNHHFYNITLANQASYYSARGRQGDYETAVRLGKTAVENLRKNTREYAGALNSLVVYYTQVGDGMSALKIAQQARVEAKKWFKEDKASYAIMLNNYATQLAKVGYYVEAVKYAEEAKENFEASFNTQTIGYTKLLNNLATFYSHQQNYKEAARLLELAMPIIEKIASKQHPDYLRCMTDLSAVYKSIGDLARADMLANESNEVGRALSGNDNLKFAQSLSKQAAVFASNGNYLRAIEHEQRAYELLKNRNEQVNMAQSLGQLASYFASDGQQQTAYETAQQSLAIFEKLQKESAFYAQALNNTAILYFNGQEYVTAKKYGRKARQMYENICDTVTAIYARILSNNALFDYVNDSLEQAIETTEKALKLQTTILGEEHPDHVPLLYNLSVYYREAGFKEKANRSFQMAIKQQADLIRADFLHLTSQEREKFWNQKSYVFRYAPMLAYLDSENEELTKLAYNSLLFMKGILLNLDIDFRQLIKESGSQVLLNQYNKLEDLQQQLENYYSLPATQRTVDLNTIKEEIYQLERSLVNGCKEYGSFTQNLNINTEQISQSLQPDEVAIEFANIFIHGRGNTYLAFLLRNGQPKPKLIRLFSDDELRELKYGKIDFLDAVQMAFGIDSIYSDQRFGKMLWTPLMKEMKGIRRIFFSPTGLFYHLGIEYLPCDDEHRINDLYEIYRFSSTKLLAKRAATNTVIKSATVYGGLNYDMNLNQIEEQHALQQLLPRKPLLAMEQPDMARTLDSLSLRGSVSFLPGTLHEAESVGEQLMQQDIPTNMLLGNEGTEESFKALNGKQQSVIHIATHGFYFSEKELKQRHQRLVFLDEQTENIDNPLNYSGLLMSGANYVLKGGHLPNELDDGVLTANEIAQIDLSQTNLVVLSACQTGVGDIREDGVFGIQRGFKKAGVQSLLMSLWSVSDQATDLMMTKFYENLILGMSKPKAFQTAQETLRKGKYPSPFYWASFILLDGL